MCNMHRPNFVFSWQQERTMAHLATYSLTFHPSHERYCFLSKVKKYQSSITEDQKRKVICFCKSRLIPALVTETLLKSFHLEGWPRYFQFDHLTLFDSVLLLCCLFTNGWPLWRVCPCFFVKPKILFFAKWCSGIYLHVERAPLCPSPWQVFANGVKNEDASIDNMFGRMSSQTFSKGATTLEIFWWGIKFWWG